MIFPMSFAALPWWQVLALAGVVAALVTFLFFLKVRNPRVVIPSLLLWQRVLEELRPDSWWERLRRAISLILALVIALLIALAIAQPRPKQSGGAPPTRTLIMDTSASMAAKTRSGQTRWDLAQEKARQAFADISDTAQLRLADTGGRLVTPLLSRRDEAEAALARLQPTALRSTMPALDAGSTVTVISDGVLLSPPVDGAEIISVFEAAPNVAVTAFDIRPVPARPDSFEAYVELTSFVPERRLVQLELGPVGGAEARRTVDLQPGQTVGESFDLSTVAGGVLRAKVSMEGDGLALDDEAYAYLPNRIRHKVALVTRGNPPLRSALETTPAVDVVVLAPDAAPNQPLPDVYVFDGVVPTKPPAKPALFIAPPPVNWLGTFGATVRTLQVTTTSSGHPMLDHVGLADLHIEQAQRIEKSGDEVIAADGDAPLILAGTEPIRHITLTFELGRSDFPVQLAFPIFVQNAMAWLTGGPPTLKRGIGVVDVPIADAQIETPEGGVVDSRQVLGHTRFESPTPGVYFAISAAGRQPIAVNLTSRAVSNINQSTLAAPPSSAPLTTRTLHLVQAWWRPMLLIALALLTLEWWTYHRRITV